MKTFTHRTLFALAFIVLTTLFLAGTPSMADAGSLPKCTIATWNTLTGESGGCTCYVAEKIYAARRVYVPNWTDAGNWYARATWSKNPNEPRTGAIAAYGNHVAYVDSVTKTGTKQTGIRTEQAIAGYKKQWDWKKFRYVDVPVYKAIRVYMVTETYRVAVSQRDYPRILRGDNSVRKTSWTAVKTYEARYVTDYYRNQSYTEPIRNVNWQTPRQGDASGLLGYIYPP
jgi:hypothetical protein